MRSLLTIGNFNVRRIASVVLDLALAAGSFAAAYVTVLGYDLFLWVPGIAEKTAGFTLAAGLCFYLFNVHKGSWRYVSISELLSVIKASIAAVGLYTIAAFLISRGDNVPRSVPVLTALFLIGGLSAARLT